MKLTNLISEHIDNGLSFHVCSNLKKVKTQAKSELDRINDSVAKQQAASQAAANASGSASKPLTQADAIRVGNVSIGSRSGTGSGPGTQANAKDFVTHPALKDKFGFLYKDLVAYQNVVVPARALRKEMSLRKLRNSFDISRSELLSQVGLSLRHLITS